MLMASRLLYGMARQSVLPPVLGKVSPRRRAPCTAILFTTLLGAAVSIVLGAVTCVWFVLPFSGRGAEQYAVAGALLLVGVVLWLVTWLVNRRTTPRRRTPAPGSGSGTRS